MKKILYFDMDGVLVDFQSGVNCFPQEVQKKYEGNLDEIPHVFGLMKPIPGGLEAFDLLSQHFDTYILSTASWENESSWIDKVQWVKKHIGDKAKKRLILSHQKQLNRGDYLIDDRPNNGAKDFQGEWIHFGSEQFPDWESVIAYLMKKQGNG